MELLNNIPLWTALISIGLAQLIKVPLYYFATKKWDWSFIFSTGGMPSSHSAAVTSLTTVLALEYGLNSPLFAISSIFAIIVMFDAAGVRRHAGEQAAVINQLVIDFNNMLKELKWNVQNKHVNIEKLKELLGHKPIEVLVGGLLGIGVASLLYILV